MTELFATIPNSFRSYFHKKTPSQMFDRVLNKPPKFI